VVRFAEKGDAATAVKNSPDECFWPLLYCSESLIADQQLQLADRGADSLHPHTQDLPGCGR
jgi:hypothetical protein